MHGGIRAFLRRSGKAPIIAAFAVGSVLCGGRENVKYLFFPREQLTESPGIGIL